MNYYVKVNTEKKTLTIDDSKKPNSRDELLIEQYLKAGYTIRFKSEKRSAEAKKRMAQKASKEEIIEILKPYEDLTEKFNEICKGKGEGHGVFAAKAWYEKTAKAIIAEREKQKEEKK